MHSNDQTSPSEEDFSKMMRYGYVLCVRKAFLLAKMRRKNVENFGINPDIFGFRIITAVRSSKIAVSPQNIWILVKHSHWNLGANIEGKP